VDLLVGALQAQPRLLDDVLGLGGVAQQPRRETGQARSLGLEGLGEQHGHHLLDVQSPPMTDGDRVV